MKRMDPNESKEMVLAEIKKRRIVSNQEIRNALDFGKSKTSTICAMLRDEGLIYRKRGTHGTVNFISKSDHDSHRTLYEQIVDACDKPRTINKILEIIGKKVTQKNRNWLSVNTSNLCYQGKLRRKVVFGEAVYQKKQNRKDKEDQAKNYSDLSMLNTASELLMMADDRLFIKQLATAIDQKPQGYFTGHLLTLSEYYAQIAEISPQKPQSKLSRVMVTVKTKDDQLKLYEHLTYKSPAYFDTTPLKKIKSDYKARKAPVPVRSSGEVVPFIGDYRDSQTNAGFFY